MVELKDQRAIEGDSIKFECQFSGTPMPGIKQTPLKKSLSPPAPTPYSQSASRDHWIEKLGSLKKLCNANVMHPASVRPSVLI